MMSVLCHSDEIAEGEAKGFELEGRKLVVVRRRGKLHVYHNSCPHRSIPLEWMPDQFLDHDKHFIQCATHGALFRIEDGECIAGPCVGDRLEPVSFLLEAGHIVLQS